MISKSLCRMAGLLLAAVLLAGCAQVENLVRPVQPVQDPVTTPPAGPATDAVTLPTLSTTGAAKVAVILPLTGNGATAGISIKNAAEMAASEFGAGKVELLIKDDQGTAEGAAAAATAALGEGASLVLGPLFAPNVSAVGAVARARGVPVIAYSSDTNVAGQGIYLLSFLPQTQVDRMVAYAIQQGRTSFVAVIPQTPYGAVAEGAFQESVARLGGRVVSLEKVTPEAAPAAAGRAAALVKSGQAQVIFAPFDATLMPSVARALSKAGVTPAQAMLIGTGIWDDPRLFSETSMAGALYAAPDSTGFTAFAQRYRQLYSSDPVRLATVGYDSVALVTALVRTQGSQAFAPETFTNPSGFVGVDGAFRFKTDGSNDRSLAILRITPQGGQTVVPASRGFSGS